MPDNLHKPEVVNELVMEYMMNMRNRDIIVTKRNGTQANYDLDKIRRAIRQCFKRCHVRYRAELLEKIDNEIKHTIALNMVGYSTYPPYPEEVRTIKVEDIQDIVEKTLMDSQPECAKEYILYRNRREQIRSWVDTKEDFIRRYKEASNTANATIDDNSNVASRNIGVLNTEIHKEDNIQISRRMVVRKLRKIFPDFDAKQYERDLADHIIYKHDESSFAGAVAPYCVALTMYPFLDGGIKGIGGLSAKPKNLDSYCGMLVNMIFTISAQFAGACLHKDQRLIVREDGVLKSLKISDIVSKFNTKYELHNSEGDWEVAMVNNNLEVWEDGKFVNISKVYRRKYNDKIYRIHTYGGKVITTSKDHRFKVRFRDRDFEVKAKDLKINDTLYRTDKTDYPIDKTSKDYKDGQLYGIIAGDGSININGIRVAVNYKETFISDWLDNYFHEYKGKPGILRDGHKCYQWEFNSREYAVWVADNIFDGTDTHTKSLKDEVFENASLDFLCGFLDGILVTDGSFQNNVHGLILTNEKLIKQISEIVIRLGKHVSPIKYYEKSGSFKNANPAWKINISKTINPYLDLTSIRRSSNHKYMDDNVKSTYYYGGNAFKYSMGKDKAYCIGDYSKALIRNLDAIKSIEVIDNDDQYVYEIETTSHWYSAGDILTHNCAVPEALLYFDYFARKEWGDDYYLHTDDIVNPRSKHPRTIGEQIHQHFQQVIYSINQPAAARGLQSAFVNFSYYDKAFYDGMFGNFSFPDLTQPIWESFNWLQKDFMQWFNEERKRCVLTFPVESFAMVYQDHKFLDPESADFVAEEYARGHSFFTYISDTVDSLSSCCRLKNKLQTKEFNFTNGNMGLQTGSKSVITINLNRIVQDWVNYEIKNMPDNGVTIELGAVLWEPKDLNRFVDYLGNILDRIYKYHTAYNELLWDMKDAHLLPVYDAGFIDLNKQYLTIGINGLNQAAEFLGMKCNDNPEYKEFCQTVFGAIAEKNKEAGKEKFNGHTLTFNTEQVPAESLAIKNYNWDKEDDYWVPEDTNLYASYIFKPNDPTTDVFEKLRLHGREYIGDYLDGGSAAHINLEAGDSDDEPGRRRDSGQSGRRGQ